MPNWKKLITSGSDAALNSLNLSSVVNAGTDTDKFLVLDSSNNIDFRTGAEVRSDIGAGTGNGTVTGTGANNQVTTWNGTTSLDGSSNFTYDGTTLNLSYTGTGDLLRLTSTDAGAASAPDLTFCRDSASPADDDTLGTIQFYGEVSGTSVCKNYASIYGRIACATNGQTKGNLSFKAECNNVFVDTANFSPNGLYVMPPDDFAITSPGIGLTVTGGVSGSTTLQIGSSHTNTGTLSSIAGGTLNTASAACSFIGGGCLNNICSGETFAVIGGGRQNRVDGDYSSVVGGYLNCTRGNCSFIGGGYSNDTSGGCNIIGGGYNHCAYNSYTAILGGRDNYTFGIYSTVVGGYLNWAGGSCSFTGGGYSNYASGCLSVIAGGCDNIATGIGSTIVGGTLNTASAACSFIGGGANNTTTGTFSSVVGGSNNLASGSTSLAGGELSTAEGAQSFAYGYAVTASAGASVAIGGAVNTVHSTALNSVAIGGISNDIYSCNSLVSGLGNCVETSGTGGAKSSITSGEQNQVVAPFGLVVGNCNHVLGGSATSVRGGNIVGGCSNCVNGANSFGNLVMGNENNVGNASTSVGGAAAFGGGNDVFASGTVAIGINNCTITGQPTYGQNSLLLGCENQNHFGNASIVGGFASDGYGSNSIAFGLGATSATGNQQYAFGEGTTNPNNGTTANIANSFVIGSYNVWNITDCHLFAVGYGSSDVSRSNAFNVSSNGRVGIGCSSPQTRLDVFGTARVTTLVETSARKYKKNIVSLQDQLDNLKKLEPVEFEWKETKKKDIGLIAEDVEKIYPQLVEHDDNGDLMGVKYSKITSLLIKAVQEQQDQIDELKKEIFILKQQG